MHLLAHATQLPRGPPLCRICSARCLFETSVDHACPFSAVKQSSIYLLLFLLLPLQRMQAASANLEWDPNTESDLAGYRIYYGNTSGVYGATLDVGNTTRATVENLVVGQSYYFVATAYNTAGLESTPSNEVSFNASGSPNQPPVIALTAPLDGSQFVAPATLVASAAASDGDGTIARVEFFSGASKRAEDTAAPFEFTWP